jgi:hypothetical protein
MKLGNSSTTVSRFFSSFPVKTAPTHKHQHPMIPYKALKLSQTTKFSRQL